MVLSMNRWIGKVVIVTGASAGCGATIAKHLVDIGLIVVGIARRKDRLNEISKELEGKKGNFYPFQADISKEEDILKTLQWIKENLGPVHILINTAGVGKPSPFLEGKTENWLEIFHMNLIGLAIITREVVNGMKVNDIDGHIIHINSILGHYVAHIPSANVYPAAKFGVTALTEVLRQELISINSKIKVTSVSPGAVATEVAGNYVDQENYRCIEFFQNLPKLQTEDVADAVIYVLSTPTHVQVHELMIRPLGEIV